MMMANSVQDEERSALIKRKDISCFEFVHEIGFEIVGIVLCTVLGILWLLLCLILPIPAFLQILRDNSAIAIPVFLSVDILLTLLLIFLIYRKWWKLNEITLVGNVEIHNQPSKKKLEIKRPNFQRKHRRNSPNSSSSYFSISELPVGSLCPGLYNLPKRINDPIHIPIPFIKWKQGCEADYLLKVTLIGESGTGKTSFREAVSGDLFSRSYQRTFGVDFCALYWVYQEDNKQTRFHITLWDTDGHRDSHSAHFGQSANCVALVYNITKPESLFALKQLYAEVKELSLGKEWPYPPNFVVLANMVDKDQDRKMQNDEMWIRKNLNMFIPIVPISCATGYGIAKAAEVIVLTACALLGQANEPEADVLSF